MRRSRTRSRCGLWLMKRLSPERGVFSQKMLLLDAHSALPLPLPLPLHRLLLFPSPGVVKTRRLSPQQLSVIQMRRLRFTAITILTSPAGKTTTSQSSLSIASSSRRTRLGSTTMARSGTSVLRLTAMGVMARNGARELPLTRSLSSGTGRR